MEHSSLGSQRLRKHCGAYTSCNSAFPNGVGGLVCRNALRVHFLYHTVMQSDLSLKRHCSLQIRPAVTVRSVLTTHHKLEGYGNLQGRKVCKHGLYSQQSQCSHYRLTWRLQ